MNEVDEILSERGEVYGDFDKFSDAFFSLMGTLQSLDGWNKLSNPQKMAIQMIVFKTLRLVNNGNPTEDTWLDICGYSTLGKGYDRKRRKDSSTSDTSGGEAIEKGWKLSRSSSYRTA